jgi:hypothetical protein
MKVTRSSGNDYLNGNKQAPQGFSLQQLQADLADLK